MNEYIKAEWCRRIIDSKDVPAEYILNLMYEECNGPILYPNKYGVRDGNGRIPPLIGISQHDMIAQQTADWADLGTREPMFPSYERLGGQLIPGRQYYTLSAIQRFGGRVEVKEYMEGTKKKTTTVRLRITPVFIAKLIEADL